MPTYISLVNYTQQGIEKIKDGPERLDAAKKVYEAFGSKLLQFYCLHRGVGEKPSPSGEDFSRLAVWSNTVN
jgi:hypothetical protein